ncbi:hypothetical protein G7Z17_g11889 [Cylindrodendrum hubeiense]|uniref:tRNA (adenine(58)-N(1))-methyltransferase non-catalytic subunit TRM6 n=1 Tax=Cylindrodendrum hubeiense TaxID=595255 RepID=A0A9P5GZD2_9HYPO|nr:hypothetical protein G7Z17_g11889 [Cylindrodendrum hubeiense]
MKVAVVGGGPAGLATLKFLVEAHNFFPIPPIEARLFEAEAEVGGTFTYRVYEDAELVSSKYLTAFSDFRLPDDAPDFVTPQAYVQYLKNYATTYNLWPCIERQTKVENIRRGVNGCGHIVAIKNPDGCSEWSCDAVAVCSGINVTPIIPTIAGMERVPKVLHSSQFRTRDQFGKDTNVVVLGAGETGMDIAHLAVTSPTKSVTLCHRDGFFCAPKIIPVPTVMGFLRKNASSRPNKPVDTSVASLFDTAYVHPVLQRSQLLWTYYDLWIKKMHWLISGTEEGPDQWVGQMSQGRKYMDSILLSKSDRALPYMNIGHRSPSWINRLRSRFMNVPIKETGNKKIDVRTWPEAIDEHGYMRFPSAEPLTEQSPLKDGLKPDVLVFATGYTRVFPFLDIHYPDVVHANARGVYKEGEVTLGFIGFVRPAIGAIPPLAELQAQFWVLRLLQCQFPNEVPTTLDPNAIVPYNLDYKIHTRQGYDFFNSKRAVDHESYAYQLALDMGAAPTITYVMKQGWKVLYTWAMGSNFNTKFRMVGPWKWEGGAKRIMRNELFNVVKRSGGYVYLATYSLVPFFFFGTISMVLYAWFGFWGLFSRTKKSASNNQLKMSRETVQPDQWVALRLPNETMRILQVVPNTTISLGKYGSFPTNLILERPFHLTYEVQEKREGETFARLRVVPAKELNADILADTSAEATEEATEGEDVVATANGEELTLVNDSGEVVIRTNREIIDDNARQTLATEEIEELKRKGASAGKELIAKLLLSHTAIDQKTEYSLAKYKLLKTKKYIRRFSVVPLDVPQLAQWLLEDRDSSKILEMRHELMALTGCWADVHFGGVPCEGSDGSQGGRWLVVDDTGGLLVAAMAERMDILHPKPEEEEAAEPASTEPTAKVETQDGQSQDASEAPNPPQTQTQQKRRHPRKSDFDVPYVSTNTITLVHSNTQPNLVLLKYFNYDNTNPNQPYPYHPLATNLMPISWLQLLAPEEDDSYASSPPEATPEVIASWKTNRRGNYHRKRRRWARVRHVVDTTRAGGFSGLAVASTMDPISIMRNTLPLLAGGAPVAIYSPTVEPLTQLADCFSVARRAAWVTTSSPDIEGKTAEELERWEGTEEFPLNPTLLLGVGIQSSRARRWQVLPGRTHPFMMGRGGADGFLLTGWRALPVEGKIEARGKFKKRKTEA